MRRTHYIVTGGFTRNDYCIRGIDKPENKEYLCYENMTYPEAEKKVNQLNKMDETLCWFMKQLKRAIK